MNSASLNNLWQYLEGLSLSKGNRRWLAERLMENDMAEDGKCVMNDDEIKEGISVAFSQLKEVKSGKRETRSVEELLNELQN
ncbi:MAG: surface protein [Bacteroidales bacterium]|nr:surface protein [Bacteroidales bacterium]